jgi:hypothetical protein
MAREISSVRFPFVSMLKIITKLKPLILNYQPTFKAIFNAFKILAQPFQWTIDMLEKTLQFFVSVQVI